MIEREHKFAVMKKELYWFCRFPANITPGTKSIFTTWHAVYIEAIECVINVRYIPAIDRYTYSVLLFSEKFNLFSERFFTWSNVTGPRNCRLPDCVYVIMLFMRKGSEDG